MSNVFPRESVEFQPITVSVDDVPLTIAQVGDVEVMLTPNGERPSTTTTGVWAAPTVLSGRMGVMVDGLAPGLWIVWARITSFPETPVVEAGTFRVA